MRALITAIALLAACTDEATTLEVSVTMPEMQTIDGLAIVVGDERTVMAVTTELTLLIPDAWAASPLHLSIEGTQAGMLVASGATDVVPAVGETTRVHIQLAALGCSTACTPGDVKCSGDGVTTCIDVGGCPQWSETEACPTSLPFCTNGVCAATCSDECSAGAKSCDGTSSVRTCGDSDGDPCLDWVTTACAANEECGNGTCQTVSVCTPATCSVQTTVGPTNGDVGYMTVDATHIYWITPGGLYRSSHTGANVEMFGTLNGWDYDVDVDSTHVYWTTGLLEISRRTKAGGMQEVFANGFAGTGVKDMAVDATHVYWIVSGANTIYRKPKAGGMIESINGSPFAPHRIALDSTHIYWSTSDAMNNDNIYRAPKAGGAATGLITGEYTGALVLDATHLYVQSDELFRIPKAGGTRQNIATEVSGWDIFVDDTHVIWIDDGQLRMRAKSGGMTRSVGVAVDGAVVLLTPETVIWTGVNEDQVQFASRCACEP